ncbi:ubiquitin-like-conjugating enzyme ATG10 [Bufo bufo]|uniref:ubiquitin-like-conjugating enzyme ATG10 n=1 Tax=Bufo bufo TaxID=8384 RepID=UPI001ABE0C12|nr:ubiquitin-like-conjugating enzyme ATG10 [Bufo bufo]XP_040277440.1 ubiquitin-like-conjugating enzyme ATG10 [Bufo bufo]
MLGEALGSRKTCFYKMNSESRKNLILGEEKFRYFCLEFLKHSQAIGDGWEWKNVQGCEEGYLSKICYQTRAIDSDHGKTHEQEDENTSTISEGKHEEEDSCALPQGALQSEVIHYEYHVLYSISYQAPVLYFRASFLDGRPLTLDAIWERVHDSYKPRLLHGPWETITQQEHPILGQPFFVLHPCRTNDFMSSLQGSTSREGNYITTWLSTVGPVVGLTLPLSYGKTV